MLAESPARAPSIEITAIRLVEGDGDASGRLEVLVDGQWGTVCDDGFENYAADVACRQLGYSYGGVVAPPDTFPRGFNYIALDETNCFSDESSLKQCQLNPNGDCTHSEDVGLFCVDGSSSVATPVTPTPSPTAVPVRSPSPPVPPPSYTSSGSSRGSSVPIGAIVGGVAGGIALIAAIAGGVYYAQRQRARRMARSPADKWLDGPGAVKFTPPQKDPEAASGGAPTGGTGGCAVASAGGAVDSGAAVAVAGSAGAAAFSSP
ncbi:hypothetical protein ABPG75_011773 [Micractinium tetrahymenae]